jgi:hypothetical protein
MPSVTLASPNGGEVITAGTTHAVTWTSSNPVGDVTLFLMRPGMPDLTIGSAAMAAGSFQWRVCEFFDNGSDYRLGIIIESTGGFDFSDAVFSIAGAMPKPTLTLTSPNGGGPPLAAGSTVNVTWTSSNPFGELYVFLLRGGVVESFLGRVPMSAGSFAWMICPTLPSGTNYRIELVWQQCGPELSDGSDGDFTINGAVGGSSVVTLTSPNGGEALAAGTTHLVTWTTTSTTPGTVLIGLNKGGAFHQFIGFADLAAGRFAWPICPNIGDGADYRLFIQVSTACSPLLTDSSDGAFLIGGSQAGLPPPVLTVTAPGPGTLAAGSAQQVTWNATNPSGEATVFLLGMNGPTVQDVQLVGRAAISAGGLAWTPCVPAGTGLSYQIAVLYGCGNGPLLATSPTFQITTADSDGDGAPDCADNCPGLANPSQADCDLDGLGDACDATPGQAVWYRDFDGDGFGNGADSTVACAAPAGYVGTAGDCNDLNAAIHPGAADACDGLDNNCSGVADEGCAGLTLTWYRDADGDGFGDPAHTAQSAAPPAGFVSNASDCRDDLPAVHPGAAEVCDDGIDNDCDGQADCADGSCAGTPSCSAPCPPCGPCAASAAAVSMLCLCAVKGCRRRRPTRRPGRRHGAPPARSPG